MQLACVVYAGIFKHRKNIPKYEKLMVALCVCTRHILAYPTIYRHMTSYDVIRRYMVGYQGVRIPDAPTRIHVGNSFLAQLRTGVSSVVSVR